MLAFTLTHLALAAAFAVPAAPAPFGEADGIDLSNICETSAQIALQADRQELLEDLYSTWAVCLNVTDPDEQQECFDEAWEDYLEDRALAWDVYNARLDLCDLLGPAAYDPQVEPADFQDEEGEAHDIDNPLLPYLEGSTWTYEGETEDGLEVVVVTVTDETREILGIECAVVRDTVTLFEGGRREREDGGMGLLVEDTFDYFAQDDDGNVWYLGELSFNFDEEGFIEDIDGSWIAGVDGARPGIVMFADPVVGTSYRQEWWHDEAEDAGTILDDDVTVEVPFGDARFGGCLQTADFTPLEPDALEYKYYHPGIGFLKEVAPETGEELVLVDFVPGEER